MTIPATTQKRVKSLHAEIERLRTLYHVEDAPGADDVVYSALTDELRKIEEEYPALITPESPTQRVAGKPLEKFQKITHAVRQWSLSDVFTMEELQAWHDRAVRMLEKAGHTLDAVSYTHLTLPTTPYV